MKTASGKMSETGRLTVPLGVRAAVGLARGGPVVLDVVDGDLRVRSVAQVMDQARNQVRAMLAAGGGASVDAFLGDRRRDGES